MKIIYYELDVIGFLGKPGSVECRDAVGTAIEDIVIRKMEFGCRSVLAVQQTIFFSETVYGMVCRIESDDTFVGRYPKISAVVFQDRVADVVEVGLLQC